MWSKTPPSEEGVYVIAQAQGFARIAHVYRSGDRMYIAAAGRRYRDHEPFDGYLWWTIPLVSEPVPITWKR